MNGSKIEQMTEIIFIAHQAEEGGYYAKAINAAIFTQAETIEQLRLMIKRCGILPFWRRCSCSE